MVPRSVIHHGLYPGFSGGTVLPGPALSAPSGDGSASIHVNVVDLVRERESFQATNHELMECSHIFPYLFPYLLEVRSVFDPVVAQHSRFKA